MKEYWAYYGIAVILTVLMNFLINDVITITFFKQIDNLLMWILKAVWVFTTCNIFLVVCLYSYILHSTRFYTVIFL